MKLRISDNDHLTIPLLILVVVLFDASTRSLVDTCGFHISNVYAVKSSMNQPENGQMCAVITASYGIIMFITGVLGSIYKITWIEAAPEIAMWLPLFAIAKGVLESYVSGNSS